ncbi:MAG: hypothetical protein ABIS50_04290 [Luteolibacter sp.]|uniref:hypothetical protein n=1 Tax=Luteolibacter sp. TaxID=1962973 RepID=UPI003267B740
MANEHPFQHLFETLGRTPHTHAESVNRQAYEVLSDILSVPVEKSGRCILLRAPRAGHGKTHLLSRIQHQMGGTHEFIPLHASFGCRIDAASVIDDTLRCLVKQLPASGGLCVLDLVTRRLFASALQPLVASGEVPCQDREGALSALRLRPIETFDFHHPNAVTAHWARENFEVLGQRLSLELAQRGGLPVREVAFWVETLFRFAAAPLDHSNRVRILADTVHEGTGGEMERLEALLGLVTQLMRVILVADDLEGFSSDETAALRFAAFLGSLRQSVDRLDVILSLNLDIWESAFVPRLSGGLADRLSEVVVELEPLKESEMAALLDSRVPGLGAKVLERIDLGSSGSHARGLIRAAGMAWLKATATDTAPAAEVAPVMAPPPIAAPIPQFSHQAPVFVAQEPEPVIEAPPVVEEVAPVAAPAFTFEPEPPVVVEPEPTWPAPEFSPPPPVEIEPEIPQVQIPEPVGYDNQFSPPQPVNTWNPPAPEPVFVAETPVFQPPVESPFRAVAAEMAPEPVTFQPNFQAPVESPFQVSPMETGQEPVAFQAAPIESYTFNPPPADPLSQQNYSPFEDAPQEQPAPQAAFQPQVEPSFQNAPVEYTSVEPSPQTGFVAQGTFQPLTASPFQPAFTPPTEKLYGQQPNFQPQVESPFQAAPTQFTAAEPAPQEPIHPQGSFQPQMDSPFQAAPQAFTPAEPVPQFQPSPEPAPMQPAAPAEVAPPPSSADTDRVDDLLKQFRERYGRGSL